MSKKKKLIIVVGVILLLGCGLFYVYSRGSKKEVMTPEMMPEYETVIVETGDVERIVYATGSIVEGSGEEIRPQVGAKVKEVFVQEGQEVKSGDLLFTLDSDEISLAYAREKLAYEIQAKEYAKEAELSGKSVVTTPVSGEVVEVLVKTDDELGPQNAVAKIVKNDSFELTVPFNSNDVKLLKVGQKVQVLLSDYLSYVAATIIDIDQKGRSTQEGGIVYNVTVEIPNPGALKAGDKGYVEIESGQRVIRSIGTSELKIPDPIEIKAQAKGKVDKVLIAVGEQVKAGEILIRLNSQQQQESMEEKRLNLELAKMNLASKAQELEKYQVRASVNGKIIELNVEAGKEIPSDKPAVVISNLDGMKMVIQVDEIDIPLISLGQKATVYTNAFGDRAFEAVVTSIAEKGKIENNVVTFATELTLVEPGPLKPGMTGDADIKVEHKENVLRLPFNAVQIYEEGKGTVMVKGPEGEPMPLEVEVGIEGVEFIEIVSGLKAGDEVLIMPGF
ncbi:MAG: efflux RND transporter periplasmic adaptor subunit [Zhaonellaceae bacterium]